MRSPFSGWTVSCHSSVVFGSAERGTVCEVASRMKARWTTGRGDSGRRRLRRLGGALPSLRVAGACAGARPALNCTMTRPRDAPVSCSRRSSLLHPRSARDELGVLGRSGDRDDEAVLVAHFILAHPPALVAEQRGLAGEGLFSVLGPGEFSGKPKGEGEALRKDFLPGNDVVPALNPDRHATGGVVLLHDSFDPAASEDFAADSTHQNVVAVREGRLQETRPDPSGGAAHLATPPCRRRARRLTPEEGGADAAEDPGALP